MICQHKSWCSSEKQTGFKQKAGYVKG